MAEEEIDIKKAQFLEILPKKNYHIGKTCAAINIGRRTFYNWKDGDEEFRERYEELCEHDVDDSEEKLKLLRQGLPKFDAEGKFIGWIEKPHFGALQMHLQAKGKDRGYSNSLEITRPPSDGRDMTDEELLAEIGKMSKEFNDGEWDTTKDGTAGQE